MTVMQFPSGDPRGAQIAGFLADHGFGQAVLHMLVDDASARKYYRLEGGPFSALLMDFRPDAISIDPHGVYENPERPASIMPVLAMTGLFSGAGWRVPAIHATDVAQGLALIEDFGDLTFTRMLEMDPAAKAGLYLRAVDQLIALHRYCDGHLPGGAAISTDATLTVPAQEMAGDSGGKNPFAGLVVYGPENYRRMLGAFKADYLPLIIPDAGARDAAMAGFDDVLASVLPECDRVGRVVIHRDFHVDNLMLVENDDGGDDCGIIDFQDAAIASRPYDLVSLLRDVRHDIGPVLEASLKDRYCAAFENMDRSDFETAYAACNMVRNFRILGRFGWLAIKAGKRRYFEFVGQCWELILRDAAQTLPDLVAWIDRHIPPSARVAPSLLTEELPDGGKEQ